MSGPLEKLVLAQCGDLDQATYEYVAAKAREQDAERAALEQQLADMTERKKLLARDNARLISGTVIPELEQRVAVLVKVLRDLDICPPEHTDCEAPTHIAYRAALAQNGGGGE